MAFRFTQASDYAIRSMTFIASLPEDSVVLRAAVARNENIPVSFVAKILRRLVKGGLLESARGVNGGFRLARTPERISLLDVIETIDGPIRLTRCSAQNGENGEEPCGCPAHGVWEQLQQEMERTLSATSIEDLVSMPRRHGRVRYPRVA